MYEVEEPLLNSNLSYESAQRSWTFEIHVEFVLTHTTQSLSFLKVCSTMIVKELSTDEGDTPQTITHAEEKIVFGL
jgi:hypothetical protein